ncbi:transcription elongation factor SPT5-like [Salvia splendens]|nr:transcription elongation factor SPT5-like [Salvia splendens]
MEVLPLKHTITQLLLSISILLPLVFTFTWSSLTSSSLVHFQNLHYFSSNTINKNFFFLVCNGILFFLTKTSPLARPPDLDGLKVVVEAETYSDKHIKLDEEEEDDDDADDEESTKVFEEEQAKVDHEFEHSSEGTLQVSINIAGSEDEEIELQDCFLLKEVDDRDEEVIIGNGGEEVDEIEKLSDDELNQKFEDFIRRMKEEFRINDYQHKQLILVK